MLGKNAIMSLALLLLCNLLLATTSSGRLTVSYDQGPKSLGPPAKLSWSVNNSTKSVKFGLEVTDAAILEGEKRVWVGIGVGEETSGGMLGADILTAEFEIGELKDCNTTDRFVPFVAYPINESPSVYPEKDKCQNWKLESCSRDLVKGTVTLEVSRPMNTNDTQDRVIGSGEQSMMYAYGNGDFKYHSKHRGTSRIVLFNADGSYPSVDAKALPDDVSFNFSILATDYVVPPNTSYMCTSKLLPLPPGGKRYLVAGDPLIQTVSGANKTHHLIVYACKDTPLGHRYNKTISCDVGGGPNDPDLGCSAFIFAWAVGSSRFLVPKDVGYLIDDTNNLLIMESHYDNTDADKDAIDKSGAVLHFSDNRSIQAGLLWLGDPSVSLAPLRVQNNFTYTATCPSNCTATWKSEINVFATFFHMHTTGRQGYTNQFDKDGNFKDTTNKVEFWSNDHQVIKLHSPEKKITPGDILSTSCIYDTTKRNNTRFGGQTKDEMCMDLVFYYPLQTRQPGDGAVFACGMVRDRRTNFNSSMCGWNPSDFNMQSNPSFQDPIGLRSDFGEVCAIPAASTGGSGGNNTVFSNESSTGGSGGNNTVSSNESSTGGSGGNNTVSSNESSTGGSGKNNTVSSNESSTGGSGKNNTASSNGAAAVCFPEDAVVLTRRNGAIRMAELRVGDEVAVGGDAYSPVFMFTHRDTAMMYKFVKLRTKVSSIRLTAGHILYASGRLLRADDVRIGDELLDVHGRHVAVTYVSTVRARGLYNPQTLHGDIVVDGVVASTYTDAVIPRAAHALLAPLRAVRQWFGWSCSALEDESFALVRAFRALRHSGSILK